MTYREKILEGLKRSGTAVLSNPTRQKMIADAVLHREAFPLSTGTLATWTAPESTGRSPQDTYLVRRPASEAAIDWSSPNCIPMEPETFEMIFADALEELGRKTRLYEIDRVVGADSAWTLPVKVVTDNALSALFIENMFRPVPAEVGGSLFAGRPFTLLALPYSKLDRARYDGRLRRLPDGRTADLAVVMDFDHRIGIVYGSAYMGSMKKLIFTVMNFYLPELGILPLHCSANEGPAGDTALLLGLSGTGKTTLSADPERALIGDDEHGWNDEGIANFEYGMYAKLINLNPQKEPEIYRATFHPAHYLEQGSIVENLMVYPDGSFDLNDSRYTENSRASFLLSKLSNVKASAVGGHPSTILFLTADADGVLPPIARLTPEQAMFWFMMGYTSKLAGTETGVTAPQATFSRFFGAPFMPRHPADYTTLLGAKMKQHGVDIYLINTGWSGGAYGVGRRIDITLTRAMVHAALNGGLKEVKHSPDPVFKVLVPESCPGVPPEILQPINTWKEKDAFRGAARKLAAKFSAAFEKSFAGRVDRAVAAECPGCAGGR